MAKAMNTTIDKTRVMRDARKRLRLTQLDLARRVGCTESMITKIETGRSDPERWIKEAIAQELGIQPWEVRA